MIRSIRVRGKVFDILKEPFKLNQAISNTEGHNDTNTIVNILRARVKQAKTSESLIYDEGTWDDFVWN